MRAFAASACLGIGLGTSTGLAAAQTDDPSWRATLRSPTGDVRLELSLASEETRPAFQYQVFFQDQPIILDSSLQVKLADGSSPGRGCAVADWTTSEIRTEYRQFPGKRSRVVDSCNTGTATLREPSGRRWRIAWRVYDDAVAFRYEFPQQEGWTALELAGEQSQFSLVPSARGFALPLNSFTTSYEKLYEHRAVRDLPSDWLLGLPFLAEIPGVGWAAITEANLTDYAGMYLARADGNDATLVSRLSPLPDEPGLAVRAALPHVSPWRVIMIAREVGRLIESDVVLNLNPPSAIADTSWIQPGKTTFPWWNGYFEENVPFEPGLNTATMKYYIDFCAEAGIPYHSLDGKGDTAWYGGPIAPYDGADPTTPVDGLDLADVLQHAKARGVGIRLWMHWRAADAHMERAFPLYREWGVRGVMLDFLDRDDQVMVNFMHRALRTAAKNHLTVVFHGVCKPTGLERTWPNLLSSEAVLNLEYDKWRDRGVPPEHELVAACARMLAGPLDFHQGSFRTVPVAEFAPRNEAPVIMGTPCRTLASYVVLQNHLSMMVDYPSAYRGHPALDVLTAIPTTWDETRVLEAEPLERVVIARRAGKTWWIGGMGNREKQKLHVPLQRLDAGTYLADLYCDDPDAAGRLRHSTKKTAATQTLTVDLAPAGGFVARLRPLEP